MNVFTRYLARRRIRREIREHEAKHAHFVRESELCRARSRMSRRDGDKALSRAQWSFIALFDAKARAEQLEIAELRKRLREGKP